MSKAWTFAALSLLALASAIWAKQGIVHLNDGTQVVGDIDESDPNQVVVILHGVQQIIPRNQVNSIDYPGTFEEQFDDRLNRIDAHDFAGRMDLARWAEEHKRYDLARRAAAEVLSVSPTYQPALEFLRDMEFQITLNSTTRPAGVVGAWPVYVPPPPVAEYPHHYLTLDQVNEIRQLELKPEDAFKVSFKHDVRERFLSLGTIDAASFYSLPDSDQARLILGKGDADMSRDVMILSDPASMAEFHSRILPLAIGGCAVSGCHDDVTAAGGFGLFKSELTPQAWYTDFYMLQTYSRTPAPGADQKLMIDRIHPENSLLVNYALPRAMAIVPHPPAANFHPLMGGRNDPHYDSFIHWFGLMLRPDGGSYRGIEYQPPWSGAHPATNPSR